MNFPEKNFPCNWRAQGKSDVKKRNPFNEYGTLGNIDLDDDSLKTFRLEKSPDSFRSGCQFQARRPTLPISTDPTGNKSILCSALYLLWKMYILICNNKLY